MPLFEYSCKKCGHVTTFLEKADNKDPHPCEKCGSHKTEKLFSAFGVSVNNSGRGSSGGASSCPTGTCPLS